MAEAKLNEIPNTENAKLGNADKEVIENMDLLLDMEMLQEDPELEMFSNLNDFQSEKK